MPNFGPLSAERPELQALTVIQREIRSNVRQIAPPKPLVSPPHKCGHREMGPQLWLEPDHQFNLGRWYQFVSFLTSQKFHAITVARLVQDL